MNIIFQTFKEDKVAFRFLIGVVLGLGFSISIILATIGIMDGYDQTLKETLKKSEGDLQLIYSDGFFSRNKRINDFLETYKVKNSSAQLHSEVFLLKEGVSKGVLLKGVVPKDLARVTGLDFSLNPGEIALGYALSELYKINIGDTVSVVFASGSEEISGAPLIKMFKVGKIIDHGIYFKNLRYSYINLAEMQEALQAQDKFNVLIFNMPDSFLQKTYEKKRIKALDIFARYVEDHLEYDFKIKPFWYDYATLIQAVEEEKNIIIIILYLVVIISVFNVLAFIFFINEIKSKEIFLLKALGATKKSISRQWAMINLGVWFFGCLVSILFIELYDLAFMYLPFFKLPQDIYNFETLQILLSPMEYFKIFAASFLTIFLMVMIGLVLINSKSVLSGLRKEFN